MMPQRHLDRPTKSVAGSTGTRAVSCGGLISCSRCSSVMEMLPSMTNASATCVKLNPIRPRLELTQLLLSRRYGPAFSSDNAGDGPGARSVSNAINGSSQDSTEGASTPHVLRDRRTLARPSQADDSYNYTQSTTSSRNRQRPPRTRATTSTTLAPRDQSRTSATPRPVIAVHSILTDTIVRYICPTNYYDPLCPCRLQ